MTQNQRDLLAIVFDMKQGQLKAAMYQIILGDDVATAIDKAMARPSSPKKPKHEVLWK